MLGFHLPKPSPRTATFWVTGEPSCSAMAYSVASGCPLNSRRGLACATCAACKFKGNHLVVQGSFTPDTIALFEARCVPDAKRVCGILPEAGQSMASFSGAYPLGLTDRMAAGSVAARLGSVERMPEAARVTTAKFLGLDASDFAFAWPTPGAVACA